jgi:site-specific DNA recombinase
MSLMPTRSAVAIYARISQDRAGEGLGVKRQLKDRRAEAERRGWTVFEEYIDDDISAYSGKDRPTTGACSPRSVKARSTP